MTGLHLEGTDPNTSAVPADIVSAVADETAPAGTAGKREDVTQPGAATDPGAVTDPEALAGPGPSDSDVLERFPSVRLDHLNKHYYNGLLRRELLAGRCRSCGTWHTPLRPICPSCWSADVGPAPVSGRGTVHLLTFLHQGPPAAGVDYPGGFPLAAIELAEQAGLRVEATVVDCPRDRLRIGLEVELTWIDRDGAPWPAFRPAGDPAGPGPRYAKNPGRGGEARP